MPESVPDESEGLVVTLADYITIRPNIVKQLVTNNNQPLHTTHFSVHSSISSPAIKCCFLTSPFRLSPQLFWKTFRARKEAKTCEIAVSGWSYIWLWRRTIQENGYILSQLNTGTQHQPQHIHPHYLPSHVMEVMIQPVSLTQLWSYSFNKKLVSIFNFESVVMSPDIDIECHRYVSDICG